MRGTLQGSIACRASKCGLTFRAVPTCETISLWQALVACALTRRQLWTTNVSAVAQMTPQEPETLRHGMRGCGPFEPRATELKAWCKTFFKDRLNGPSMYSISC
jgi:hypothetical protein